MIDPRHQRQMILPEVGEDGQQRLRDSSVLVVGLGGLGSPVALYLAAAGVGQLGLMDDQRVDESNLQRQILYDSKDVGRRKAEAAAERICRLDSGLRLDVIAESLTAGNAGNYMASYDVTVDGTDAFETKFLLNDAAIILRRPLVHGAVLQWGGQITTILPGGPCLRCLFREPPEPGSVPTCEEAGILGSTVGIVGSTQAEEVLKLLLGVGQVLSGRIHQHDGLSGESRTITFPKDPDCPACSNHPSITDLSAYEAQVSPRGHVLV
jgi:molybdopterin/thiamine biosynthesis adenylyltransferase